MSRSTLVTMNNIASMNSDALTPGTLASVNTPRKEVYRMVKIRDVRDVLRSTFAGCDILWCRLIVTACRAMAYAMLAVTR